MRSMPSSAAPASTSTVEADGNASSARGKLRAFRYLRSHSGSSSRNAQNNADAAQASTIPPPPPLPDQLNSDIAPPAAGTSAQEHYEAWLDSAFQSARGQTTSTAAASAAAASSNTAQMSGDAGSRARTRDLVWSPPPVGGSRHESEGAPSATASLGQSMDQMASIRLVPHHDPRSNRPSLAFPPTSRTLPHEDCVIRVGRYSERDVNLNPPPNVPSSAPIGFKSKVVSRRHCEFWCAQGQWYIKDVKSSSGTFLNHIRLSQPNVESRPWPVNDGDVVQLGIDFRGGEEMIFRCVKIRVECNRGWQKTLNNYNVSTHNRLRNLGKSGKKLDSDAASAHSSECAICLMSISPCQSLFVAPCSHVWHYKCIRPILNDHKTWPSFLCPNCRALTDLEADVEDPNEWSNDSIEAPAQQDGSTPAQTGGPNAAPTDIPGSGAPLGSSTTSHTDEALAEATARQLTVRNDPDTTQANIASPITTAPSAAGPASLLDRRGVPPMPSPFAGGSNGSAAEAQPAIEYLRPITPTEPLMGASDATPTTEQMTTEGPQTPTNNAGPFVFDGSAGRSDDRRRISHESGNRRPQSGEGA